jgi:hypothetical protein
MSDNAVRARLRDEPCRSRPEWLDEAWWNELRDLSRFAGKSDQEVGQMLSDELRALRPSLFADDDA